MVIIAVFNFKIAILDTINISRFNLIVMFHIFKFIYLILFIILIIFLKIIEVIYQQFIYLSEITQFTLNVANFLFLFFLL